MMKQLLILLGFVACASTVHAQEMTLVPVNGTDQSFQLSEVESITFPEEAIREAGELLQVYLNGGLQAFAVNAIDSMKFENEQMLNIYQSDGGFYQFNLAFVDSLAFAAASTVYVEWSGESASVENPFSELGVFVEVEGGDVTVSSAAGLSGIVYSLSGNGSDGMFKVYSDSDFVIQMNGLELSNQDGPAINVQADVSIQVELVSGSESSLTDGTDYADPPVDEDQKGAFFSEGQLLFVGGGSLLVVGTNAEKHGIASDDFVDVQSGNIVINSAGKDGIHTNEGYFQSGGVVDVQSDADGVDAGLGPVEIAGGLLIALGTGDDQDALKCDGEILIQGGELELTVEGDMSKGLNASVISLLGGIINIVGSGDVELEPFGSGYDPSYCAGIKVSQQLLLDGAQLNINSQGEAGRGISSDGSIAILSGELSVVSSGDGDIYTNEDGQTDVYHGPCLNADGDITLVGGSVTLSHSGDGGKAIAGDGNLSIGTQDGVPVVQLTTTGSSISLGGGDSAEAKAISVDSLITIADGHLTIQSADDAIKSKTWIDVTGGLIEITNSVEGLEAPNVYISGGEIHLVSSDDGINSSVGVDGEANDGSIVHISGGYIHLAAATGDCIDSNGTFEMNGGVLLIHGPTQGGVGLDVNGSVIFNGGFTVVSQKNGNHVEVPSNQSGQRCVLLSRNQLISAGNLIRIEDSDGNDLVTFMPERGYSSVLVSSPDLNSGTSYNVYTGGSCTGTVQDGLYDGGSYTPGTLRTSFTSSGVVQEVDF